jgi:hypothetical protein
MSFDLYFLALGAGETWQEAMDRLEDAAARPADLDEQDLAQWDAIRAVVEPLLPGAEEFTGDGRRELSDDGSGIQLALLGIVTQDAYERASTDPNDDEAPADGDKKTPVAAFYAGVPATTIAVALAEIGFGHLGDSRPGSADPRGSWRVARHAEDVVSCRR